MRTSLFRCCVSLALLTCMLLSTVISLDVALAAAPHPVQHSSMQKVQLQIIQGRIFFHPNTVTCSLKKQPCFEFIYAGGNYGPRPLWLDHQTKLVLTHGQILAQTFMVATIHYYYLFQFSQWWKVKVIVNV